MIMVVIQTIVLFTFVKTLPANFNQEKIHGILKIRPENTDCV